MKTILLLGKNGQVGWELQHALLPLGRVIALDRSQLDLTRHDAIRTAIREISPDIVVNAAGYTAVDRAEEEPDLAMAVNATAPRILAEEVKRINALLIHFSTDYVYDGAKQSPYLESDSPNPLNTYGKSKLAGERAITSVGCAHLILRASWIYSTRRTNFVLTMLKMAQEREIISVVDDQVGSPSWAKFLALSTADIIPKMDRPPYNACGVYHLSASGHTTRLTFAGTIIDLAKRYAKPGIRWARIVSTSTANYPLPAARPLFAATSKAKMQLTFGVEMATWQDQLQLFIKNQFEAN